MDARVVVVLAASGTTARETIANGVADPGSVRLLGGSCVTSGISTAESSSPGAASTRTATGGAAGSLAVTGGARGGSGAWGALAVAGVTVAEASTNRDTVASVAGSSSVRLTAFSFVTRSGHCTPASTAGASGAASAPNASAAASGTSGDANGIAIGAPNSSSLRATVASGTPDTGPGSDAGASKSRSRGAGTGAGAATVMDSSSPAAGVSLITGAVASAAVPVIGRGPPSATLG